MSVLPKDVLLVGFGAVGAIYSLILKRGGLARVTVVARSNYRIASEEGIHFQSKKYGDIKGWRPDRLCQSVAEAADRPYSYVMITTKAIPELIKTSKILAPLLTPEYTDKFAQPTYVLVQNGLNVEPDLYNTIKALGKGEPSVISSALWIGTNLLAPNVVEHNHFDRLSIGMYRPGDYTTSTNSPEEATLLEDFGKLLEAGGTTLTVVSEIQRIKFAKNFWNVAFSSFPTLTQYTVPAIFRPPPADPAETYAPFVAPVTADLISEYTIPAIRATLTEVLALGRALGFPDTPEGLPSSTVDSVIEGTRTMHVRADSTHVPSMLLDARKGLPIEVEVILGEVVRLGKLHNVALPRVETLYALLLIVQNQILRNLGAGK